MTGQEFAAALPLPLVLASVVFTVIAMGLLSLASHGRCREVWGETVLLGAVVCLVLALGIGWSAA